MFIFNIANPITLILMLAITLILIFLGKETKKGYIVAIALAVFLMLLIWHVVQVVTPEYANYKSTLSSCIAIDFTMILLTFLSYLWVDDLESKEGKKKSIDNSLDWFWSKI